MTSAGSPAISIGMPLHNEERHIAATLETLCSQDYEDFEIIISDNASTDRTLEICREYAARDTRLRIEAQPENIGATANFQRVLELARGERFVWAAGHDLWSKNFLSACINALQANPNACLAFACSEWIGDNGQPLPKRSGWSDTRGMDPISRLMTVLWGNMHPIMGLMQTTVLRECLPLRNMAGGDLVLLSQLSLRGEFVHAHSAVWQRREMRQETSHSEKLRRYAKPSVGIVKSRFSMAFPLFRLPLELVRTVIDSQLPPFDKIAVLTAMLPSLPMRYIIGKR